MIFPCNQCGLCCIHLEKIPELKQFDLGNGRCKYLSDDNRCTIYERRPDICNVSRMYDLVFHNQMTEEEYININLAGCREIKMMYENKGE